VVGLSWRTFRQRIPPPKKRLIVWIPRLASWELAALAGHQFTILSGTNAGTIIHWREVSDYLVIDPPPRLTREKTDE
jgi:hypothetical protein